MPTTHKFGIFDLFVLAVVLALITALLLPSFGRAHYHSGPGCTSQLRYIGTAFSTYAASWNDALPTPSSTSTLHSLCEQTPELATLFDGPPGAGPSRKLFYCPSNRTQDPATLWSAGTVSIWGYVLLNDRGTAGAPLPRTFPPRTPPLQYISKCREIKNPGAAILALDVIVSDTASNPTNFAPKSVAVPFGTSHITGPATASANILYLDGHVEKLPFTPATATPVPQPAGGFFWFPNP